MISIVQRITEAKVVVDGAVVGEIGPGLLVLAAVEQGDGAEQVEWMASKIVGLRVFRCCEKHFDVDVKQIGGSVLLVSNFTVAAETRKGRRPSFDGAMDPKAAEPVFNQLFEAVRKLGVPVQTGKFGAMMQVSLTNAGP
ncbi:MAG TPA: D-aminoacyl-tRNA deacylase, partial [Tepidisphaeraceae bacterium]